MDQVSDSFAQGFCDKCAEMGVDAEALIKQSVIGGVIRGAKEMAMTGNEIAKNRYQSQKDYMNKGVFGRLGQALWDPAQAARNRQAMNVGMPIGVLSTQRGIQGMGIQGMKVKRAPQQ